MCTIGAVFTHQNITTFKQCDLIASTVFHPPQQGHGSNGVKQYTAMTREGSAGIWAGMNDHGVAFVAADAYTTTAANYAASSAQVNALFAAYEKTVSAFTSAQAAAESLIQFYRSGCAGQPFPAPDISLISGWLDAARTRPVCILIEYMPNPFNQDPVRTIVRNEGFFVSTNNFRLQPNAVDYPANHSTYLRLQRAEMLLQAQPTTQGVLQLLQDQYYGATELSICRETDYIGTEFRTQATAVFEAQSLQVHYQINGNPRNNPLQRWHHAFAESAVAA